MYTLEGRRTCAGSDGPTPDARGAHARYSLYARRPVAHTLLVPEVLIFHHQLLLRLAQLEVLLVLLVFVLARLPSPTAVTGLRLLRHLRNTALPTQNVSVNEYESHDVMMMQIG